MRGVVRPCRHNLGPELHRRWRAHLCGLCLTLRDEAGQSARILTGYDVLLVGVLVEAQAGPLPTTVAAPCPLRGFQTAQVVLSSSPAMQLSAATALLGGAAGLEDKIADGDIPVVARPVAARVASRFAAVGGRAAGRVGLDPHLFSRANDGALAAERRPGATLDELLQPAGEAVAALFSQTAIAAGIPSNGPVLSRAGDAFGRLVHLLDAVEDRASDERRGRFNPLQATRTPTSEAADMADCLHHATQEALGSVAMVDRALVDALFGPTLHAGIDRVMPRAPGRPGARRLDRDGSRSEGRTVGVGAATVGIAAMVLGQAGIWGGRNRRYDNDPYYRGRGYGRRGRGGCGGPSCGEMLACDCCANMACDNCGGDDQDCCCCCA